MSQCLDNIRHKTPPIPCPREYCAEVQSKINKYCSQGGLPCATPIPLVPGEGEPCWCCCCSSSTEAAIATSRDTFTPLLQLKAGDTVLVSDLALATWHIAPVVAMGRLQAEASALAVDLRVEMPGGDPLAITLAGEALLLDGRRVLRPANRLRVGDELLTVDQRTARVTSVEATAATTALPFLGALGAGDSLAGHVFNLSGLVGVDLAVGMAAVLRQLPHALQPSLEASLSPIPLFQSE